jgi:hypothetical protein
LELAPVAMLGGVKAYLECLQGLAIVRPDIDVEPYSMPAIRLVELWPTYLDGLTRLDNEVWPDEPVRPPVAVLAVSRTGIRRWWLHLPVTGVLIRAQTPDLPDWFQEQVDDHIQMILSDVDEHFRPEDRWVTIAVGGLTVNPDPSGRWIPDTAIMVRTEEISTAYEASRNTKA